MVDDKNISYTPMMKQYLKIKEDYADALVFFRLGDFYELFFDDAIIASKILDIVLTSKGTIQKIPMAGVPHHAIKPYVQKLIQNGYKVAIAEQVGEVGLGLVDRRVTRLITPGTIFEDEILDAGNNNYIASFIMKETGILLTYADISTGESFLIDKLNIHDAINYIVDLNIKEVIIFKAFEKIIKEKLDAHKIFITIHDNINNYDTKWNAHLDYNLRDGARHLLNYFNHINENTISHLQKIKKLENLSHMNLGNKVKKQLEILESNTNNLKTTLFHTINFTKTPMGTRLLKHQLNYPLMDIKKIEEKLNYIASFIEFKFKNQIIEELDNIYDINRIIGKISFKNVNPKDFYQLKLSLKRIKPLKELMLKNGNNDIRKIADKLEEQDDLINFLENAIVDDPPFIINDGKFIKDGFNKNLDELRKINQNSQSWLLQFEEEERKKTGIKNLKIGYNRIFGYFIEISKAASLLIKDEFQYKRKQTLANSERFTSSVLKEKENQILSSKANAINLEIEIFDEIKKKILEKVSELQELSNNIGIIDVYLSHAISALKNNYVKPIFNDEHKVEIISGRHPVIEKFTNFIANDVIANPEETFIITGPNMSGKSTYMRMFALIIYMAQIGSFVPAKSALIPIYDSIFTRIGSSDDLSGGMSTFMIEMIECNEAIVNATKNSLILFDEVGRGTATYDGLALAHAIIEYIHLVKKCQMFFSTHYHELTKLSNKHEKIINLHVKAVEEKNKMIFLHKIEKGYSYKSYGIQVAALAKLPQELIKMAESVLLELEGIQKDINLNSHNLNLETKHENYLQNEIINEIKNLKIDEITPIDALIILKKYQEKLED